MGANTSIEWTDASWPVLAGCKPVSPGCANCYAERLTATRLKNVPKYKGLAVIGQNGHPHFTGESRLWREHLDWPLKWKQPRKIFVADMSDLFYEGVSDVEIDEVFAIMARCPQHTFQVLTKRADRMRQYFERWPDGMGRGHWIAHKMNNGPTVSLPLRNVWLGVSVENQKTADERIPHLLETPAAVRFLSVEPMLESIGLGPLGWNTRCPACGSMGLASGRGGVMCQTCAYRGQLTIVDYVPDARINWCIVGGESGPGARPFDLAWARSIVRQCRASGTRCFVKQLGSRPIMTWLPEWHEVSGEMRYEIAAQSGVFNVKLKDRKGGDPDEWESGLRVREFPEVRT